MTARSSRDTTSMSFRSLTAYVKVFGCRPDDGGAARTGRRPQTSKGDAMRQAAAVRKVRIWHSSSLM